MRNNFFPKEHNSLQNVYRTRRVLFSVSCREFSARNPSKKMLNVRDQIKSTFLNFFSAFTSSYRHVEYRFDGIAKTICQISFAPCPKKKKIKRYFHEKMVSLKLIRPSTVMQFGQHCWRDFAKRPKTFGSISEKSERTVFLRKNP